MATYVAADNISETVSGKTSSNTITFTNLKTGMYLVLGKAYTIEGYYYTPIPFLVVLTEGDDVIVDAKYDKTGSIIDEENYEDYFAHKIWVDDEEGGNRPQNITIHLLKDGIVYDTVTLNKSNQWEYKWKDLNTKYHWSVIEENVPKGYTVSITQEGTSFIVTNTFRNEEIITDSDPDILQTGDEANIWPYVGILVSGILIAFYLILTRKKRKFEDR
ncbi:MAG: Cna B-type domain-containing protein [Clostridium sp.]|uniref:Cna B-type domain-containing protein n=1 Tax=Clostridium sp. TaxID=1506 RepID=UPI0025BB0404|nr:Cna B-type domain-containing protein [Clostridium sp.]MCF0147299.1 Cna B-type domain-containing protein [Clostridium sp.]